MSDHCTKRERSIVALSHEIVEDLIVAILAVNSYPMERVARILPELRSNRLTDPEFVAAADLEEVTRLLYKSGYERGTLVGMFAERLKSLMAKIENDSLDEIGLAVTKRERDRIGDCLRDVKGVGPKVIQNALLLIFSEKPRQ